MLSAEAGADHPDRNVVTSALLGKKIPEIDCPREPLQLHSGDTLIVASDGLQFLSNAEIEVILRERMLSSSSDLANALLDALNDLGDPDLDNISMAVIRVKELQAKRGDSPSHQKGAVARDQRRSLFRKVFKSEPYLHGAEE